MSFSIYILASKRNGTFSIGSSGDLFERERFDPTWRELFLDFTV